MKESVSARGWLSLLLVGCLAACGGKLNVHQTNDEPDATGKPAVGQSSGGTPGASPTTDSGGSGARLVGKPPGCPDTQPSTSQTCGGEGAGCGYLAAQSQYQECSCVEWGADDLRWYCQPGKSSGPSCPTDAIANGADCFGHFGSVCSYPVGNVCTCNPKPGVWECTSPKPPTFPDPPAMLDPGTAVHDLTDAERAAWCAWEITAMWGPGFPPPADAEVGPDGKTTTTGSCTFGHGPACSVAMPTISPAQCAQNLKLSSCAEPIAELTDCVTTLFSQCVPSPHGCARYMAAPGCNGTMVTAFVQPDAGAKDPGGGAPVCSIRLQ